MNNRDNRSLASQSTVFLLTLAQFLTTAFLSCTFGIAEQATESTDEDLHALVIGASRYGPGWPILTSVPDDVMEVTSVLTERGFKVEPPVIDPDIDVLRKALQDFVYDYGQRPENRLLIYFSGHGYSDVAPDGRTMGYIVPVDAPKPYGDNKADFYRKAMDMDEIVSFAKRIRAKHALFVFDSCFSGTIFGVSRSPNDPPGDDLSITYKLREPVRQFITAGDANEKVPGDSRFRKLFVEALRGDESIQKRIGQDGYLTGLELGDYLQREVIKFSGDTIHPQYGSIKEPALAKGDFVFRMPQWNQSPTVPPVSSAQSPPVPPASSARLLFSPILFSFESRLLSPEDKAKADGIIDYLRTNPDCTIEFHGYVTDKKLTEEQAIALSQRFAEAVMRYTIENGIPTERVSALGHGQYDIMAPEEVLGIVNSVSVSVG